VDVEDGLEERAGLRRQPVVFGERPIAASILACRRATASAGKPGPSCPIRDPRGRGLIVQGRWAHGSTLGPAGEASGSEIDPAAFGIDVLGSSKVSPIVGRGGLAQSHDVVDRESTRIIERAESRMASGRRNRGRWH
jgi:hypothetical protein